MYVKTESTGKNRTAEADGQYLKQNKKRGSDLEDKIKFLDVETGEEIDFYIIEETRINNINYLLVAEDNDDTEEAAAYILKDLSSAEETEARYEMVENDDEIEYVSKIFGELLDDVELER